MISYGITLFEMNKKVLVTGADGFIGSHLVEELVKQGYAVKAFVAYNSFNTWGWLDTLSSDVIDSVEIFAGDIRDPFGVGNAIRDCNSVMHLAALIAIPYSYHSPATYIDTNINGTLNVLQAAKEFDVERVIHTSTSEVYGTAQYVPIDESHPLQGQSPYSASKIGADQIAYSFYASFATPVITVRPFNTYGPRQSARAVIPTVITQILSGSSSIKLGSITPTRDFNYVKDTVSGFISAMIADKSCIGETINIGSNYEISIHDTVMLIGEIFGKSIEIVQDNVRVRPKGSEVERLYSSNSKAKQLLGWTPNYAGKAGLKRGLTETIEWFSNPNNVKAYKSDIYNI